MDSRLTSLGYELLPSKYKPEMGYSGLKVVISGKPTQRFFDTRILHIPTFDGRFFHRTQVSRHELATVETFQVCLGEFSLESFQGEHLRAFSFGGVLTAEIEKGDLYCELTTKAPLFKFKEDPGTLGGGLIVDEIKDILAQQEVKLPGHQDELYARLSNYDSYRLFLACLVSLQNRLAAFPLNLRQAKYQKISSTLNRVIQSVRTSDGWDGDSPSLEDLIFANANNS